MKNLCVYSKHFLRLSDYLLFLPISRKASLSLSRFNMDVGLDVRNFTCT